VLCRVICIMGMLVLALVQPAAAAPGEDGTYEMTYTVYQGAKDSVSIANDYFEKPARVIVLGEQRYVELTLNHASWILELAVVHGQETAEVEIISEDTEQDLRVVRFAVEDTAQPVEMQTHVRIEQMEPVYDHRYAMRLVFDESSAVRIGPAPELASQDSQFSALQIAYLALTAVAVVLIVLFLIWMFRSRDKARRKDQF